MRYDAAINIVLQFDSDIIFRIASFEITEVGHTMKEGKVVDDRIKIKVVILSIAGDVKISNPDGGVAAEHENGLGFIGML